MVNVCLVPFVLKWQTLAFNYTLILQKNGPFCIDMETDIVLKTHEDLAWDFESGPFIALGKNHWTVKVDPFPGYAHDLQEVRRNVGLVRAKFPITWPVTFYLLSHESTTRTNAWAQAAAHDYDKKIENAPDGAEQYERDPFIVFSGKRIPPMPAMTRYLVPHEYGHIVEDWIAVQRGQQDHQLLAEYAKLRGLPDAPKSYGGGWHLTPGEIFANDFRILMIGAETDFWPHPVPRPWEVPEIIGWWSEAHKLIQVK